VDKDKKQGKETNISQRKRQFRLTDLPGREEGTANNSALKSQLLIKTGPITPKLKLCSVRDKDQRKTNK
jgi:hypothetical protein